MRFIAAALLSLSLGFSQPAYRMEEIAKGLGVVYAITTADVNGDKKPDIVAINNHQLLWFENPSWTKHVVAENITKADNVALAPLDIDRDGKLDFALGADWQSTNTTGGGSLHWVSSDGKVHNLATEPTLHRIRFSDVDGDRRPELIVVPLHGRGTKGPAWNDGPGARILVFRVPKNPAAEPWPMEVADESLHIAHNFITVGREIWVAAAEGIFALRREQGKWRKRQIGEGQPGEIKMGTVHGKRHLATVEPWHGNSIVVYEEAPRGLWLRTVIESKLNQAHALGWTENALIAGWRGKPWGLAGFVHDTAGGWTRFAIDDGVAVEDLAIADLNGDGREEIIAGGRATANIRVYWRAEAALGLEGRFIPGGAARTL
ncbi:MAG: FG-GAP-like repeat-containing protein [Bryobacteraceae bacterium]|nr:FG-GAP-like repeat-containing protein [Bryobacteraceae bacterium]